VQVIDERPGRQRGDERHEDHDREQPLIDEPGLQADGEHDELDEPARVHQRADGAGVLAARAGAPGEVGRGAKLGGDGDDQDSGQQPETVSAERPDIDLERRQREE